MRNSTCYKLAKAKTFRRSSSKILPERNKADTGWGSNLENVEKSLRTIYIADGLDEDKMLPRCAHFLETGDYSLFSDEELSKLRVLLQPDQSGAEALIVAYDTDHRGYRDLFLNKVKPHVFIGLHLFPEDWKRKIRELSIAADPDDVDTLRTTEIPSLKLNPSWKEIESLIKLSDYWSAAERFYYLAKQTCHSGNYDIQWATFQMNILEKSGGKVVISKEQARDFLEMYRGLFPEIPERNRRIKKQVNDTHIIYNLFGFPYTITSHNIKEHDYKQFYAWGPQSTVAEINRTAFSDIYYYAEEHNLLWDNLNDCHDSILEQVPLPDAREAAKKLTEFIGQEFTSPIDGMKFKMKSEIQIGFNWGPFYKDYNPLGLREVKWLI